MPSDYPDDIPVLYADDVRISTGLRGFRFYVGVVAEWGEETEGEIVTHTALGMSPESAKEFCLLLARAVSEFEEKHGPISRVPAVKQVDST